MATHASVARWFLAGVFGTAVSAGAQDLSPMPLDGRDRHARSVELCGAPQDVRAFDAAATPDIARQRQATAMGGAPARDPFAALFVADTGLVECLDLERRETRLHFSDDLLEVFLEPNLGAGLQQQPAAPHPTPRHTGFKALVFETGADVKAFPRRRSTWVILAIGGAAAALAHPVDDEVNARLVGSNAVGRIFAPGKYIGSVPVQAGIATGLYLVGRYVLPRAEGEPKTNKLSHLGFDLMRAVIVSQALTQAIKITVRRDRPTGECCAFPSGHASVTFATAAVLERHLGYRAAWPTLLVAAYVGASRMHDNRHFLSDVLFGSALGMATGWTIVGRHGRSAYVLIPAPTRGGMMIALVRRDRSQSRANN